MEQLGVGFEPILHGLERGFAAQRGLRQLMIVQVHVAMQGCPQVLARPEVMGLQDVADAAIEAFHHTVGLRRPGLGQSVLDAQGLAELVELVRAARLTVLGAEQAVGELLAVVASLKLRLRLVFGQKPSDLDRAVLVQGMQKGPRASCALVGVDGDVYLAGGAIGRHEEIALRWSCWTTACARVYHRPLPAGGRPMAHQQAMQRRARHAFVNELAHHHHIFQEPYLPRRPT